MIKKLSKISRYIAVFLVFVIISSFVLPACATYALTSVNDKVKTLPANHMVKTVKVGFPNFLYFSQVDKNENGESVYSGLIYDYLVEIEKYTGWKFEFIEGPVEEMIPMLESGEIDVMGGILKDKSVIDTVDFAEYPAGETYSILAVDEDNDKISELDFASFQNMNVGLLKSANRRNASLQEFCDLNEIKLNFTYYDNNIMYSDLRSGKIDAILTNDISLEKDQRSVLRFAPANYYFATTKGNTEILQGLNMALSKIFDVNPSFDSEIYAKYFQRDFYGSVYLSGSEKKFVKENNLINVAVIDDWAPISYFDKNGKSCGITASVFELISKKTGLNFNYIKASSLKDALDILKSGRADLIAGVPATDTANNGYDIVLTTEYMPLRTVILKNDKMNMRNVENSVLGLSSGYNKPVGIKNSLSKEYLTVRETVEAVNNGEVDYMYISTYAAEYYQNSGEYENVSTVSITTTQTSLSIGMAKPANPILLSILDKTVHSISENEIQSIIFATINDSIPDVTLLLFIKSNIPTAVLIFFIVAAIIIVGVFLFYRLRMRLAQQVLLEGERYRILGEIADEYIYSYDFKTGEMNFSNKMSRMIAQKPLPPSKSRKGEHSPEYLDLSGFFSVDNKNPNKISELELDTTAGVKEWFRLISTVIFDNQHQPIRGMGKLVSIQREKQEKSEMESKINHDDLTGLYTGAYCTSVATKMLTTKTAGEKYALFVIDIDHFKKINDNMGHQAGDVVLCEFAAVLKDEFEPPQLIGRWGGDEFIAFIPNVVDEIAVSRKAARLCRLMDKTFTQGSKSVPISLSVGICISSDIDNFADLFKNADSILYKVKNERRNGFEIYKQQP